MALAIGPGLWHTGRSELTQGGGAFCDFVHSCAFSAVPMRFHTPFQGPSLNKNRHLVTEIPPYRGSCAKMAWMDGFTWGVNPAKHAIISPKCLQQLAARQNRPKIIRKRDGATDKNKLDNPAKYLIFLSLFSGRQKNRKSSPNPQKIPITIG